MLVALSLRNNSIVNIDGNAFSNLTHLETLDLSQNVLSEDILKEWNEMRYLKKQHYRCLLGITNLYLNGNLFSELKSNQFAMFPMLYKITLSYVGCAMHTIERAVFNNSALKQIFFRGNSIMGWKSNTFENMTKLKKLYLSSNQITTLEENILPLELRKNITDIELARNPFSSFLVTGAVMYRYRWHIRYFIYMVRYSQRQEVDNADYEYDAFVAYCAPDRTWVIKTLLPVLEGKENLKLCLHDRDFQVGKLIVDNIVDSIQGSRKIIIVLSNEFAQSGWCQFELNLIQRHVLENGQRLLVVVMLEEIDTRHVTKAMRAMLQTTTYLMWGEEEYARKAFFNRLRMLLHKSTGHQGRRRLSV
ncbi:toll-like receptor 4 [Haliotis cracherodii]|uniref:toll-like receptor 4 n=1 Tax=Haliotis cracherodii TaxID=6455 RepID=UPI0039E9FD2B